MCFSENHKVEIDKCKSLQELFTLWQKAHIYEPDSSTIPHKSNMQEISKHNFIADGCYNQNSNKATYLYILKESNLEKDGQYDQGDTVNYSGMNWRREKNNDSNAKKQNTIIRKLFKILTNKTICNDEISFLNINKRGGYSKCDGKVLNAYACQYKYFILKEIELISPTHIICANETYEILKSLYNEHIEETGENSFSVKNVKDDKNMKFYFWYHPSSNKNHSEFKKMHC